MKALVLHWENAKKASTNPYLRQFPTKIHGRGTVLCISTV